MNDKIYNSVMMYRKKQQGKLCSENNYITCGQVKNWTASGILKVSDSLNKFKQDCKFSPEFEGKISNSAFLLAPFHRMYRRIINLESFLYPSAFGKIRAPQGARAYP